MKEMKELALRRKLEKELEKAEKWIAYFPSVLFEKVNLKTIKKREEGKRGRPSKYEKLKTY
ncbi:transposase [Methanosarcina barkeri CM1]|uniref:Transposase n=1 Tax=Methanosarcina barkeri CM1 TaxID=796385 RepID=A0A0G3CCW5_METBA|nr:transposase [Methanosarcina barkeri CM1]